MSDCKEYRRWVQVIFQVPEDMPPAYEEETADLIYEAAKEVLTDRGWKCTGEGAAYTTGSTRPPEASQ